MTRMDQKLTQSQLAELAGVGVKTIHRIEGGNGGVTDSGQVGSDEFERN